MFFSFFFFNDTATTEIYTLSLHDALPISTIQELPDRGKPAPRQVTAPVIVQIQAGLEVMGAEVVPFQHECARDERSEEHTSELQSRLHLVCRLLLEKKKKKRNPRSAIHVL